MSEHIIVELPDGAKIHFGGEPEGGLAEVGFGDKVARPAPRSSKRRSAPSPAS